MSKFTDVFSKEDVEARGKSQASKPGAVVRLYNEIICDVRKQYRSGVKKAKLSVEFDDRVCNQRRIAKLLGMLDTVFGENAVKIKTRQYQQAWNDDDYLDITVKFSE